MNDDDLVFKALADPTRRLLLDRLFARDGRTLLDLAAVVEMTRFGVMKHLRVLEDTGLAVTHRSGREKLHLLNAVPVRLIHDRWIDKYTERPASALTSPKTELEEQISETTTKMFEIYIKASPKRCGRQLPARNGRRDMATGHYPSMTWAEPLSPSRMNRCAPWV